MIKLPERVRVFVATEPQDMRKQSFGLAAVVSKSMHTDPKAGDLFLFVGRRKHMLKALFHDGQGFVLLTKTLDRGTFQWITGEGTVTIDGATLANLLKDVRQMQNSSKKRSNGPEIR